MKSKKQNDFLLEVKNRIVKGINKNLPKDAQISEENLEWAKVGKGDIAFPCFILSKSLRKSPIEIAKDLGKKIDLAGDDLLVLVKNEGGYLNFTINKISLARYVLTQIQKEKDTYGSLNIGKNKEIVIEYISPNTNKPLHMGHLRNAFIGSGISNILRNVGYKITSVILFNDRGSHICQSMLAYKKWGNDKKPDIKLDHFVGGFYVLFSKKAKEDEKLREEAQKMLLDWEKGEIETIKLWKKMNSWALSGFNETFNKIGVKFDQEYFESNLYKKGKDLIDKGVEKKIFDKEKNGAVSVSLDKYNLPKKILQRADGTALYIAQDLSLSLEKFTKLKPDVSIYIVGNEQDLYFKQLFAILEMLKIGKREKNYHLSYGMVNLPEGKMKSREGKVVDADDLIKELENLATKEIKQRDEKISAKNLDERAEKIALAAIKYYMLQVSSDSSLMFDPKKSLDFKGKTGPYLLYTYARINSILGKAGLKISDKVDFSLLADLGSINLLLAKFPQICLESAERYDISILAKYLYELAEEANKFYHAQSVLKSSLEKQKALVLFLSSVNIVLKKGMNLLGIEEIEKM